MQSALSQAANIATQLATDAEQAATSLTTALQADLTTVMEPGPAASALDTAEIRAKIAAEMTLPDQPGVNKDAIIDKMAAHLITELHAARKSATEAAKQRITAHLTTTIDAQNATTIKAIDDVKTQINSLAAISTSTVNTTVDRQAAIDKFNDSTKLITDIATQMQTYDTTIQTISNQLDKIYTTQDTTDSTVGTEINRLQTLRKNIQEERTNKQRTITEHFDGTNTTQSNSKKTLIELSIPTDLQQGKGQKRMDNMNAFLRGRANEYYAVLPYLYRSGADVDYDTGTCYQPPVKRTSYIGVDDSYKQAYTEQATILYLLIKSLTPDNIMNKIRSTYKYGLNEQLQAHCDINDGPSAYFALLSLYRPVNSSHRDALMETFNSAWSYFTKGDYKRPIKHLRPKLNNAIELGLQLNWSTTGKKIVQILSRNDHVMAQELKQYEKGPTQPADTNTYLQDLFAAIEAECDKAVTIKGEAKNESNWHANLAHADHQFDYSYSKGKGSGKGSGKSKGKSKGKSSKGKGKGKSGGKGRPICCAEGCQQHTPHSSKALCTTCFKKLLDNGSSITKKDGTTFQLHRNNKSEQSKYGFTADQLVEGLLKRARTADSKPGTDDRPAPACVKRQRQAQSAAAVDADPVQQFLSSINLE